MWQYPKLFAPPQIMIEGLPTEVRKIYNADFFLFRSQIDDLKSKSIAAKKLLFTEKFEPFLNNGNKDNTIEFLMQFFEIVSDLTLFPDNEVFSKLKELSFSHYSLRWFVDIEDILIEIERINNLKGVFILPSYYLFNITSHLKFKMIIGLIQDFGLNTSYNNADTNIVYKDFSERYRRREYNEKLMQKPKMDFFEQLMNLIFDLNKIRGDKDNPMDKRTFLQPFKDNTSFFYSKLDSFYCQGISRDKVYKELFPLVKMVLKDYEFLTEEEFWGKGKDANYDGNYNKYKISRVKKILQKK